MEDRHRSLLRRHSVSFRRDLEPKKILPYLVSVLDSDDEQQIKNQPIREDQVDRLLDILPRRGPQAFRCFVEALENVQPHLGYLLREDEEMEKKFSEMKSELGRVRSYSAKLRDELRVACVSLESEKNKQDNIRKELEELKSLHKALLYQSKNEKDKLTFNISELNNTKDRLTKDLQVGKQEKLALQNKCSKLEKELQNKNQEIERFKIENSLHTSNASKLNSKKVSNDETANRENVNPPRKRTKSEINDRISAESEKTSSSDGNEGIPQNCANSSIDILYGQSEELLECIQHNAELIKLERKLDHLTTERDFALEKCKKLEEQVKTHEKKKSSQTDKATITIEDLADLHICNKCFKLESDNKELQQAMEKEVCRLQEEARKFECKLKETNDKYEKEKKNLESNLQKLEGQYNTSKQEFTDEIKNLRNEMASQHDSHVKDLKIAKEDLECQVERDKLTISRLKSELDRERETNKTQSKDFEKFKKKTTSEKKQVKKKFEEEIKSKGSRLKDLEAELKETKDEERKGLESISKLREQVKEQEHIREQLRDELKLWRTLPGRVLNFKKEFDRNGIIYTLGTNFNRTPFINPASSDNYRINVRRSSCNQGHPMDILDPRRGTLSCTADIEHSWWQVDLGETYALFVTHYTLRHGRDNGLSILRNWNLEGSRDGRNWRILRRHDNDRSMKGVHPFYTGTWAVEGKTQAMRYFRIHQTGKNSSGRHALYLSGFEMYGVLLEL